jgi:hypothetical protein
VLPVVLPLLVVVLVLAAVAAAVAVALFGRTSRSRCNARMEVDCDAVVMVPRRSVPLDEYDEQAQPSG